MAFALSDLTTKERQILRLIAVAGYGNKQIAKAIGEPLGTLRGNLSGLKAKLNLTDRSRMQLAKYYIAAATDTQELAGRDTVWSPMPLLEKQIVILVAEGSQDEETAHRLKQNVRSITNKLRPIYHKLGVIRRYQLPGVLAHLPDRQKHLSLLPPE